MCIRDRRNSASVHVSGFSHTIMSAGFPGWDGRLPATAGTIAEILRDNGYNTFAVGKYGVTPDEEATDAGPFDHWPTGKGFDHFFGFLGSQTDQYKPDLVEDQAHVRPDGRHLSDQMCIRDRLGSETFMNHYAAAWAWALSSPFQGTKQDASHLGGTTDPLVIVWPGHIKDAGGLRSQFSHVNDIAPTIYDLSLIHI